MKVDITIHSVRVDFLIAQKNGEMFDAIANPNCEDMLDEFLDIKGAKEYSEYYEGLLTFEFDSYEEATSRHFEIIGKIQSIARKYNV